MPIKILLSKLTFYAASIVLLIILSLGVSFASRTLNLPAQKTLTPFGVSFGPILSIIFLSFLTWGLESLNLFRRYPYASILLVSGVWSNFLELLLLGSVVNYLNLPTGYSNIPEIQIWIGLIMLNWQLWQRPKTTSKTAEA